VSEVNKAIANFNQVLDGDKKIGVEARLADADLLKMTGALFLAMFFAVLLANAITK
jgi:hypothetical protein